MDKRLRICRVEGLHGSTVIVGEGRRGLGRFISGDMVEDRSTFEHAPSQVGTAALRVRSLSA